MPGTSIFYSEYSEQNKGINVQVLQRHNQELYIAILLAVLFLFITALGPGLFSDTALAFNTWQFKVFNILCHQDSVRSFSVSGIQMAVCARCLGIYGALFLGWVLIPFYALLNKGSINSEKSWLIAAILLNLGDIIGNYFGVWTNTLISRFILGSLFGLPLAFILTNEFFTINKSE